MFAGLKRAGTILLVAGTLIGCEDDRAADKKVRAAIAQAREAAIDGTPEAANAAIQYLSTAASTPGASNGMLAIASAAQAQAELEQGNRIVLEIERKELELRRVVFEITQLVVQVRSSGSAAAGYRQFDPKIAREQIAAKVAEAQGGAGKPAWFTHGDSTIPTLSAVKQDISRLEGEITQLQEQIKNVTAQRSALTDDAEKAAAQAEQLKGREAVDVFKKSSDLRKQAGEKAIELDKLNPQLARLQRDLSIAKGQEATLNEVIAQLQAQSAVLDEAWKQMDAHITRQKQLAGEILGSPGAPSESSDPKSEPIAQKAVELDQLAKEIDKLRADVVPLLDGANKHYSDAYDKATAYTNTLQGLLTDPKNEGRPEKAAWESSKKAIAPLQYRFQQAGVLRVLGTLYSSSANSLSNRISLRDSANEAFKLAELKVPAPIDDPELAKKQQAALAEADEKYKASENLLTNIIDGGQGTSELQANARLSRTLTNCQWAVVERMMHKQAEADAHITAAKADRDAAAEFGLPIPAMPAELGPPPVKVVAQPTPEATPEANPEEAAVRTVLNSFADAIDKGDIEAMRALCQIDPGQEQSFDTVSKLSVNSVKLHKAMKTKFAEKADEMLKSMPNLAELFRKGKLRIDGDNAFIEGLAEPNQKRGDVVKVDGTWKILIEAPESEEDKKASEANVKLAEVMGTFAADIEGGKYSTIEEFAAAFAQAIGLAPQ